MEHERKSGQLKLEGSAPMQFIEDNVGAKASWTPEQEEIVRAVGAVMRAYLRQTKDLANGKFSENRNLIPDYLANPGNVLIAICSDGIVIRFEKKSGEKGKTAVAFLDQNIAFAAELLSQRLIHVASTESQSVLDDSFGIEIKLQIHTPSEGKTQDMGATRIWFQAVNAPLPDQSSLAGKPYCLLSVLNQLMIEMQGEMISIGDSSAQPQPFISRSILHLPVGWDCIEVYPGLDINAWKEEFAPLWAENSLLGALLVSQTRDSDLASLDPKASARRKFAALLSAFKALIDSDPEREQALQTFLEANPVLLCPTHVKMWPKLALGAKITDFVFRNASNDYVLVELERSTLKLFKQDGHPSASLTHAQSQIADWYRYLEDNLQTVQRELGLHGITPSPNGLLVIGRSHSLLPENRRKLQTMMNVSPKLKIMTYDDVYENAKAVLENLLGPMWDTGGLTQIYYPGA